MERIEEFVRNAEDAERKASRARVPKERDAYLTIAQGWRQLAEARRLKLEPPADRS